MGTKGHNYTHGRDEIGRTEIQEAGYHSFLHAGVGLQQSVQQPNLYKPHTVRTGRPLWGECVNIRINDDGSAPGLN